MGVDYYACDKCSDTYPDCGPTWRCEKGHSIGPCCLSDSQEYPENNRGELLASACPCCQVGGTELAQSRAQVASGLETIGALGERDRWRCEEMNKMKAELDQLRAQVAAGGRDGASEAPRPAFNFSRNADGDAWSATLRRAGVTCLLELYDDGAVVAGVTGGPATSVELRPASVPKTQEGRP